ncbi:unnamed protein product, partial [Discosporangium mesarthrocarpum]
GSRKTPSKSRTPGVRSSSRMAGPGGVSNGHSAGAGRGGASPSGSKVRVIMGGTASGWSGAAKGAAAGDAAGAAAGSPGGATPGATAVVATETAVGTATGVWDTVPSSSTSSLAPVSEGKRAEGKPRPGGRTTARR